MIEKREIISTAGLLNLDPRVVEKDYVLGWLLKGIGCHPRLGAQWAFKGGTCLKKCYFETYRFSEDLDFTVRDPALMEPGVLTAVLEEVCEAVAQETGIEFPGEAVSLNVHPDPAKGYIEGRISYVGPLRSVGSAPRIRLDLNSTELVALEPEYLEVDHPYTDRPAGGIKIWAYPFEEVFAEKIRALAERARPRDLYDVIHLYRRADADTDRGLLLQTLARKCAHKGIAVPTFQTIDTHPKKAELVSEWKGMLAHQLAASPPLESFLGELPVFFEWLGGIEELEEVDEGADEAAAESEPEAWASTTADPTWVMPLRFSPADPSAGLIDTIRFAGANRVCLELAYVGKDGKQSQRLIEPYGIFLSREGVLCIQAANHEDGQFRLFRGDGIRSLRPTDVPFEPRYPILLEHVQESIARVSTPSFVRRRSHNGPRYVFRCPVCNKVFVRKKQHNGRSEHKNREGWRCFGHPYFIRMG